MVSLNWFTIPGEPLTGNFNANLCRAEIGLIALDGFFFSESVKVYLNTVAVSISRSADGKSLVAYREYKPLVWAPAINKHPGSETVDAGGWASFVATANYCNGYTWRFISPDGAQIVDAGRIATVFPDVTTSGNGYEKINVYNIPASMDSWKIRCTFESPGGSVNSNPATITVRNPEPDAPPPTDSGDEEGHDGTEHSEAAPGGEDHEHDFSGPWQHDDVSHWHECSCGEIDRRITHSYDWVESRAATYRREGEEQGKCSVCGHTAVRTIPMKEREKVKVGRLILYILGGLVGFVVIVVFAQYLKDRAGRRRRARENAMRGGKY